MERDDPHGRGVDRTHGVGCALGILAVLSLSGCSQPSSCGRRPPTGTPAYFHTAPGDHQGYSVTAPIACPDDHWLSLSVILIRGRGTIPVTSNGAELCGPSDGGAPDCSRYVDWPQLLDGEYFKGAGLGRFVNTCPETLAYFLITDWGYADSAVDKISRWLVAEDLALEIGVFVGDRPDDCRYPR